MDSTELYARAQALEDLADDLETVMDASSTAASSPYWDCPNARDVRHAISGYKRSAQGAARQIRTEARTVRSQALAASQREHSDDMLERSGHGAR